MLTGSCVRATAAALAIYAVVTYRRLGAGGYSDQIRLVQPYGFNDEQYHRERGGSTTLGAVIEKRRSSVSSRISRSLSINDSNNSVDGGEDAAGDLSLQQQQPMRQRSASYYNHERDTQFDDYVAARRRSSSVDAKGDVERAMAAEFGWGNSPPVIVTTPPVGEKSAAAGYGSHGVAEQQEMVLAVGGVANARVTSVSRLSSVSSGHVLVSVPEEEDEAHSEGREDVRDREALLRNHERRSSNGSGPRVMQEVDLIEPRWRRV